MRWLIIKNLMTFLQRKFKKAATLTQEFVSIVEKTFITLFSAMEGSEFQETTNEDIFKKYIHQFEENEQEFARMAKNILLTTERKNQNSFSISYDNFKFPNLLNDLKYGAINSQNLKTTQSLKDIRNSAKNYGEIFGNLDWKTLFFSFWDSKCNNCDSTCLNNIIRNTGYLRKIKFTPDKVGGQGTINLDLKIKHLF